ncbi:MAG: VanW family protein, partial [Clostridia bacterium]|nr:VanW family protein [Clostridia bacterium]
LQTAEKIDSLTVYSPSGEYVFSYPEISFRDNFEGYLSGEEPLVLEYYLCGAEGVIERICADNSLAALSASATFSAEGFTYEPERNGYYCDRKKLQADLLSSLARPIEENGKIRFQSVKAEVINVAAETTLKQVKEQTVCISSFTTYFQEKDVGRSRNIELACERINGLTLKSGAEFSFNAVVGERTKENGFEKAKIIQNGEFILGIGGGVCQVSTTLYNAVLLAGLEVTEFRPHSLAVGYVAPSRDAMVSSYSDFRFKNNRQTSVYLSAKERNGALTVKVFGKADGNEYKIVSRTTGSIPPPEPIVRVGAEEEIVRQEKEGIKSEGYLETYRKGALVAKKRLRVDEYAPVRGIIVKKVGNTTKKIP